MLMSVLNDRRGRMLMSWNLKRNLKSRIKHCAHSKIIPAYRRNRGNDCKKKCQDVDSVCFSGLRIWFKVFVLLFSHWLVVLL